jgi:hypothetical protein
VVTIVFEKKMVFLGDMQIAKNVIISLTQHVCVDPGLPGAPAPITKRGHSRKFVVFSHLNCKRAARVTLK